MYFPSHHERGAKKNILRPHEKSNLRLQIPTKEKSWPSPTKT